jgi:hypothetical protein
VPRVASTAAAAPVRVPYIPEQISKPVESTWTTVSTMNGSTADAPEPDVMGIYDDGSEAGLTCRVCGSLIARLGDYPKVHWDWHEASNGA